MKGYGLADVDRKTPITPNTIFRIGSVTKSFTAVVVLQLHERGQLTLKDPVAKYFPGFPAEACIARRARLHLRRERSQEAPRVHPRHPHQLQQHRLPAPRPDRRKVSGTAWENYLRENIFQPLGMKHSGWDTAPELPGRAVGYLAGKDGYAPQPPAMPAAPTLPAVSIPGLKIWFAGKPASPSS